MFDYKSNIGKFIPKRKNITIDISTCANDCINNIKELINVSFITPVDLYFKNATSTQIRDFARKLGISIAQVQNKQITLNHSN